MADKEVLTAEDVKELQPLYAAVISALKEVYDPEIPVNIYDLGLIYELTISKAREVSILMTFTAPNCPMADQVMMEVQQGVESVPGVTKCTIELTSSPNGTAVCSQRKPAWNWAWTMKRTITAS